MNAFIFEIVSLFDRTVAALWAGFLAYTIFGELGLTPAGQRYLAQLEREYQDQSSGKKDLPASLSVERGGKL